MRHSGAVEAEPVLELAQVAARSVRQGRTPEQIKHEINYNSGASIKDALAPADRDKIAHGNAERLLGL